MAQANASTVPFFDEGYTFADRERELVLMENLLTTQVNSVRMELALVRSSIMSQAYLNTPGAPIQGRAEEQKASDV